MSFVILKMHRLEKLINIDKDIQSGEPVFRGTRTPIYTLFHNLEAGMSLEWYLKNYRSVSKKQAEEAIAIAGKFLTSKKSSKLYETLIGRKPAKKIKAKSKRS